MDAAKQVGAGWADVLLLGRMVFVFSFYRILDHWSSVALSNMIRRFAEKAMEPAQESGGSGARRNWTPKAPHVHLTAAYAHNCVEE